jgi:Response regulator containing CheY-like receiver, AAA-type ATPase, and DNA-binding domains
MNNPLILVVEDDAPIRNLIITTLKLHDYKYLTASNGDGAIMQATSHIPDIVLLDLGLPDIDGVEVIKKFARGRKCLLLLSAQEVRIKIKLMPWTQAQTTI